MGEISANLNIRIKDIVTKIPITASTPAFNPNRSIITVNAPSGVCGISNSVTAVSYTHLTLPTKA